jgi:hypothetical protein
MNALFFWGWLGWTLLLLLDAFSWALREEEWGILIGGLFISPLIGVIFGGLMMLMIGPIISPNRGDEEAEVTVGDILDERLRKAARRRKRRNPRDQTPSTDLKAEEPAASPENIEPPQDAMS